MGPMYYIGLDVHKQKISYCVKESGGKLFAEGWIPATRFDLDRWMNRLPQPWSATLEAGHRYRHRRWGRRVAYGLAQCTEDLPCRKK